MWAPPTGPNPFPASDKNTIKQWKCLSTAQASHQATAHSNNMKVTCSTRCKETSKDAQQNQCRPTTLKTQILQRRLHGDWSH
jgi:hypothetical protein